MTTAEIRLLTINDLQMVLASEAFDAPANEAETRCFFDDGKHMIVGAIVAGRLIGFASGVVLYHPDKSPMLFIAEVGVNEEFRREGIARRLTDRLCDEARAHGCEGIWVATEADNEAARALYRSCGARETEGVVVYDWDGAMDE